ncbi:MAG: thermonuclease family protein [Deltaproteobacteria bacterium]|nr:thermonuclease family protein [Deltaproteobacteria bacterium]MCB9788665.1 thermonuclease family protein [Deltaproteobacteria bacterium]
MSQLLALVCLLLSAAPPRPGATPAVEPPASFEARAVRVVDGDTLDVLWHQRTVRIRLVGVDAPERRQAFGKRATGYLKEATRGRRLRVVGAANDRYERRLAEVFVLTPAGSTSLNRQLVARGLAWHYLRYSDDAELARLERQARERHLGLWADPAPVPPWEFRSLERRGSKRPSPRPPEGAIIGNVRSHIFHAPGCPDREKVAPHNRQLFATDAEARAAGYRPARNCPR